ncbi:hypothetical protein EHS25_000900 [Saitozyma podzolica]|uniref:Uncharacterized protein n=1 Tax=Saitozyma podzolica TaxID=1890683 RepID=A0A427YXJ2_9TREE|nr:hypothetical protein EHS25_000900 [Saitozyma podzolica]
MRGTCPHEVSDVAALVLRALRGGEKRVPIEPQAGVNVLLNGLPDRFGSFVDSIWTAEKNPSIEDIKISILRVNAGQLNRSNEKAIAARKASLSLDSTTSLSAFYAGLKKSEVWSTWPPVAEPLEPSTATSSTGWDSVHRAKHYEIHP